MNSSTNAQFFPLRRWRELVWPREHGSWSLALEPLVLGMVIAPSIPGAWLSLAVFAGFFARRPLKIAVTDAKPERRSAARRWLAVCGLVAGTAFGACLVEGGIAWLGWLIPIASAGAIFLYFDLRGDGREELAEVAGCAAFACVPAAIAALAGWRGLASAALALVMIERSVPTVLSVRALLREQKTGRRQNFPALAATGLAVVVVGLLVRSELAPRAIIFLFGFLALRATALLVWPHPGLRARTVGIFESALGALFILATSIAWALKN